MQSLNIIPLHKGLRESHPPFLDELLYNYPTNSKNLKRLVFFFYVLPFCIFSLQICKSCAAYQNDIQTVEQTKRKKDRQIEKESDIEFKITALKVKEREIESFFYYSVPQNTLTWNKSQVNCKNLKLFTKENLSMNKIFFFVKAKIVK